jgi:transposase
MSYRPLPPIREDLDVLQRRLRQAVDLRVKTRLHLLVLIQSGSAKTQVEAAERLAVHRNTVGRWLRQYETEGLNGLCRIEQPGAPSGQRTLPAPVFDALQRQLEDLEGFGSYIEVQQWLKEEFGLEVPYKSVHKLVRYRLKAKLKRPRPRHAKKTSASPPALLGG